MAPCVGGRFYRISGVAHVDFCHFGRCSDVLSCYQGATNEDTQGDMLGAAYVAPRCIPSGLG